MSNFCNTELCASVESKATEITSADTASDLLLTTFLTDKLATNRTSKIDYSNLPDANTVPNGHLVYLDDVKVPVIASNGTWIGLDGRTIGTFIENQLFTWGINSCGQLGHGALTSRCSPAREYYSATDWCQASGNCQTSLAVKTSGELWGWGGNTFNQLGDGTSTTRCSPVREFCSATDWCQVSAGFRHSAAVKTTGELWGWGSNCCGALGDGTVTQRTSPIREFCSDTNWCQVSLGQSHSVAIKTSGQLWAWGNNVFSGPLGDGTITLRCSPVREICSATDWCFACAGRIETLAIKTSGELWGWGNNTAGSLGIGTNSGTTSPVREFCSATDWCQVSRMCLHTVGLKTTGQIWSWGCACFGNIGDGSFISQGLCSPIREFCSATDWCYVSAGGSHTSAVKTDGTIWSWGRNNIGQLGDGTSADKCSPVREYCSATDWCSVSAGFYHALAINAKTVVCR